MIGPRDGLSTKAVFGSACNSRSPMRPSVLLVSGSAMTRKSRVAEKLQFFARL